MVDILKEVPCKGSYWTNDALVLERNWEENLKCREQHREQTKVYS